MEKAKVKPTGKSGGHKFKITEPHFLDADVAREYLEAKRWPDGAVCPHCGVIGEATKLEVRTDSKKGTHARKGVWKCRSCEKQFSVTIGTIFEASHIPLNKWLHAFHLLCASKKGMSAHQLHRMLGVTYKSAWFMAHRIRYAMTQEPLSSQLAGTIEIDETYVGGKREPEDAVTTGKLVARFPRRKYILGWKRRLWFPSSNVADAFNRDTWSASRPRT